MPVIAHIAKIYLEIFGIVYSISGNFFIDSIIFAMISTAGYNFAYPVVGKMRNFLSYDSLSMSIMHWALRIPFVMYGSYGISKLIEFFDIHIIL